ncbi:BamA/TamA family outer membrane protein [Chryseolinea lacunae]|uniref:BamA/TamA family outer membrane protein n=1 Tax=Chryseolinea lacunae TaxID=2801331 RepID=A0ABS1KS29_9BACT|nr:BamA/TamA family outer membrane protein [Chryseolinea lacunae]MBL0741096.1 BamA/TamA family outer membrane protein [Chryseolinea lacunae]
MGKKNILFVFIIGVWLLAQPNVAQGQTLRVVLTGNSADVQDVEALFSVVDRYAAQTSGPAVWVFNGDAFSTPAEPAVIARWLEVAGQVLDKHPQLTLLVNQGEREWNNSARNGWETLQQLEHQTQKAKHPRLIFYFDSGCPGPWTFSLPPFVDIILLNAQWWNHPYEKPLPYMNACSVADEGVFLEKMNDLLDESKNKRVLLVSHFPVASLGNYGGHFPATAYLAPPLMGSALVSFHQNIGSSNDLVNERLDGVRKKLDNMMSDYAGLIMASGHEKNQSIVKHGNNVLVNSGALTDGAFVYRSPGAMLASSAPGFIELTYNAEGKVSSRFFKYTSQTLEPQTESVLTPPDVVAVQPLADALTTPPSSQTVIAGKEYDINKAGRLWLGAHYRRSWNAAIQVNALNLDTTFQGLTVIKKGGGRQTTSLKLSGGDGREYVFRSVNKDPVKALSYDVRGTVVSQVIKDQTSTQQPYGALAASYLLDRIDILHARPTLYILPESARLGEYRSQYANLLGMLEDSPTDKIRKEKIFGNADHIERSYKLFQKLYEDHDNRVDRFEFCRARVFDIWVGDWGKHEDNWKWAGYNRDGGILYRPIPRDRDHVFSRWDGVLPYLADRAWAKESGENFDYTIKGLRSLMHQARHMDRLLTNQLTRADWINAAKEIQSRITPEDIAQAVRQMPAEIYATDGAIIEAKLRARIKDLPRYAAAYYDMLAREVDVVGSNKSEYFRATRHADGTVTVMVCDVDKQKPDTTKVYYRRTFVPSETKEIRLYGLTNNDVFVVEGEATQSILIRIVGGDAGDSITDVSRVRGASKRTLIYQQNNNSTIATGHEAKRVTPKDENLYHYQRTAFAYNTYFPFGLITYNPFNGLAAHVRTVFTRHNFSKPDFSVRHVLSGSISSTGNFDVSYKNQLRYLVGKWDGIGEAGVSRPLNYNYFFGVGNDTKRRADVSSTYYRAQFNSVLVRAGLMRSFWKQSQVAFTAGFESAKGLTRRDSYLADAPEVYGTSQLNMVSAKGLVNLDFRDDRFLPQRGFRLGMSGELLHINQDGGHKASVSEVELEHYLSTYSSHPLTFGVKGGAGWTSGRLPFYKLFSLGQLNDLHGFPRNRYTGESKGYLDTELRWQILQTRNSFIPVKVGVRAFYDIGRVWASSDSDSANYWHQGYGGGFYVAPFMNQFAFNVSFGASREEPFLFMFGIGGFL